MAVARMAAHNPGVLAGAAAAAAGRLLAIAASADPSASWPARLTVEGESCPEQRADPGRETEHRQQVGCGPRRWVRGDRRGLAGAAAGLARAASSGPGAQRAEGDRCDQEPRKPRAADVGGRERSAAEQEQAGDVRGGEEERGGVGGDGDGNGEPPGVKALALGGAQGDRYRHHDGDVEVDQRAEPSGEGQDRRGGRDQGIPRGTRMDKEHYPHGPPEPRPGPRPGPKPPGRPGLRPGRHGPPP
jgi:hypothetical protein